MMIKKSWFTDFEILEINRQVSREESFQGEPSTGIETQILENQYHHRTQYLNYLYKRRQKNIDLTKHD